MTDAMSGAEITTPPKPRTVSRFMKTTVAVELLRAQHGEANARKIALQEQKRARRARSRLRFEFWGEVAKRIAEGGVKRRDWSTVYFKRPS